MPRWLRGKEFTCWHWRHGFDSWVRKIPCRTKWHPLQYSCLENPMDKGGWQATVCGIMYSNSCPSSRWCHPAISSSVVPFSACPQSLPASGFFPVSQLFSWGGQSIGVSASASVLPMNTQDWSPSEWTGWISLQSKGLSRVFSNTTVHHFFFSWHYVKA